VLQGLSLPYVIEALGVEPDTREEREENKARILAADAATRRLDEIEREGWVPEDTLERMRGLYAFRRRRFKARFDDEDDGSIEERSQTYQRLRRDLLDAERHELHELRRQRKISDDVMNRVQRDLDLEDTRLDVEG
jgi:CPA1 family monovalent cation:H+ antiporter